MNGYYTEDSMRKIAKRDQPRITCGRCGKPATHCNTVRTVMMPAAGFYYLCAEHAALKAVR